MSKSAGEEAQTAFLVYLEQPESNYQPFKLRSIGKSNVNRISVLASSACETLRIMSFNSDRVKIGYFLRSQTLTVRYAVNNSDSLSFYRGPRRHSRRREKYMIYFCHDQRRNDSEILPLLTSDGPSLSKVDFGRC